MIDIIDKINGDEVQDYQYNSVKDAIIDLVKSTGQTPDTDTGAADSNETQLSIAAAIHAAGGNYYTESGVANAYVLGAQTISGTPMRVPNSYFNGMSCRFIASVTNTTTSTVNVAGLGIKTIKKNGGTQNLTAGDIVAGIVYDIVYNTATGFFELLNIILNDATTTVKGIAELATDAETITGTDINRVVTPAGLQAKVASATAKGLVELATDAETITGTDTTRAVTPANLQAKLNEIVPVGTILDFAGTLQPNYLLCNGASLNTTTYATLFAKIGYVYGGSGTSFSLPDGDKYFRGTGTNALGTELSDEVKSHKHEGTLGHPTPANALFGYWATNGNHYTINAPTGGYIHYTNSFGGTETRPVTLVVTKMIRYQ